MNHVKVVRGLQLLSLTLLLEGCASPQRASTEPLVTATTGAHFGHNAYQPTPLRTVPSPVLRPAPHSVLRPILRNEVIELLGVDVRQLSLAPTRLADPRPGAQRWKNQQESQQPQGFSLIRWHAHWQ